jgi:hypothetical protein
LQADILSKFRRQTLGAGSIYGLREYHAPFRQRERGGKQQIPFTYVWSPNLLPKPSDWPPHVDVAGFAEVQESDSEAKAAVPDELVKFLIAGPPPVYVGFGSMVLSKPRSRVS